MKKNVSSIVTVNRINNDTRFKISYSFVPVRYFVNLVKFNKHVFEIYLG